ncbi:MAG: hypothetical protein CL578_18200 [Alteromonadaceae bacterium]|uniref:Tyr recombinase domain-containing protein n=2 Tax=Paraglaciecola TaxID=1621534 RepID=A0ABQ0I145_9ALTE|nr:hypothetical protein [Paraglaciecola agarilytica]MBN26963.1 hypothetical protein [Alteromonadaceae bacterium]GAC03047.1 hypothetical protein GAGA_0182 [Paraglaciecola agarilytica NO2]
MNQNKALLNIDDPIFAHFAPEGSLFRDCLLASRWDDKNDGSNSLAHYNSRLAISKLIQSVELYNCRSLMKLLSSPTKSLSTGDVVQGFKSADLILKEHFPVRRAKDYGSAFRRFVKQFSGPLFNGAKISELPYESVLWTNSDYQENLHVGLFEITTKGSRTKTNFVDPDFFPNLFKKDSVLHCLMKNVEASSKENPLEYSVLAILKAQIRTINDHLCNSSIAKLLNTSLHLVEANSISPALIDYERKLYALNPKRKNNQISVIFRQYLFNYALTLPEHLEEKNKFKTNFLSSGKLKFKPKYAIRTINGNYSIDSFQLPSVLPTESLGEVCFKCLQESTKHQPTQGSDIEKLIEVLKIVEQNDYTHMRLLFAKKPQDLIRYHVGNGLKELEQALCDHFPRQEKERLAIVRQFINLCPTPIKNGKLISEMSFDSQIVIEDKPQTLAIKTYSKTNGKKKTLFYQLNLTKIADLLSPDGLLTVCLNDLKNSSILHQQPSSTLSSLEVTLGYVAIAEENEAIKHVLTSPLRKLNQRDFRLGFSELEDIIDAQNINTRAAKSQALRTFLNKHAGKINDKVEIKNCGFSTRFSAGDERKAQKLIEPIDENGTVLPSPVLEKHLSLEELKKRYQEYLTKPIDSILDACKQEIANYKKLLDDLAPYTSIDESGQFTFRMPEEVSVIVSKNQLGKGKLLKRTRLFRTREKYTKEVMLGAYVQHQLSLGITLRTYCLDKRNLVPDYVKHWFPNTGTGMKDLFWSSVFLPKHILLICYIRLAIKTTWNKDVIAILDRSNLPDSLPQSAFTIGGFKEKVSKHTKPVSIEPHEKELREVISFLIQHHDNMISYGAEPKSLWDTPDSTKLSFLSGRHIDNFREQHTLPYFRLELLAKHQINLRKGIDGDVIKSQMERNHGSLRVTAGYLSHPIAQLEYEANNADFQRRLETTVQFRDKNEKLKKYGFDPENIDEDLLIAPSENKDDLPEWFLLPDGSSCTDIFAPVDKSKKNGICRGRLCHKGDGCQFNRVQIGVGEFVYTLRRQAYYLSRGMALLDKHGQEYFDEYIAPDMRFTFGLAKYVEFANPSLFKKAKGRLADA